MQELFEAHVRVLIEQVEKLNEVAYDFARRDILVGSDAPVFDLDEGDKLLGGELAVVAVEGSVHLCKLLAEDKHLLGGQRLQVDDRGQQVACARARELPFRKA